MHLANGLVVAFPSFMREQLPSPEVLGDIFHRNNKQRFFDLFSGFCHVFSVYKQDLK